MKSWFAFVALSAFITIAVFGFTTMNHEGGHGNTGCIASMVQGVDCSSQTGTLDMVFMHANVFSALSSAVFNQSAILLLLLSLLLVLIISSPELASNIVLPIRLESFYLYSLFKLFVKPEYVHWLALHENSPAVR